MTPAACVEEGKPLNEDNTRKVPDNYRQCLNHVREFSSAKIRQHNENIRFLLSEFLGTFMLVAIGDGAVAQLVLSRGETTFPRGNIVQLSLGWGLAVAIGVWSCLGCSGGHINPAFTIAAALFGRMPWRRVPFYFVGQYLGAFFGALAVFLVYQNGLDNYESLCQPYVYRPVGINCSTAGIFATYPSPHVADWQGFIDQIFATGFLVLIAFAVTDHKNVAAVPHWAIPPTVGTVVVALVLGYEYNCGAALNPARDFGPRLFTAIAGWGATVFRYPTGTWWLVPIFGPHIGAILGAGLYIACVGMHLPETKAATEKNPEVDEFELKPASNVKLQVDA